ncbi:MAG: serine/threonine protein kinase [Deltaproteobacteria bacterium]|nr:serine/threonine protein kinase [Deltaproteobacteria bacterium]
MWRICSQCGLRGDDPVCPDCDIELETIRESSAFPGRLWPGHVLREQYEVGALIGVGGMGAVYRGRHRITRQDVAIKVLWRDLSESTAEVRRFTREARAASILTHPNTVRVFDFGRDDASDSIFMIMEFLVGEKLSDALRGEPVMAADRVVTIMNQVCKSLEEAHRKGIVHRDLKPDNIFLQEVHGEKDFVKVLDFGLAKFVTGDVERDSLTRAGYVVGSPEYMAPEQAIGSDVGPAVDIYAAGIMLYEMLTGDLPFDAETTAQVLRKHIMEGPPEMRVHPGREISSALRKVVMRCLEKDPADRPPSAEALRILILQAHDRRQRRAPSQPIEPVVIDAGDTVSVPKPKLPTGAGAPSAEPAEAEAPVRIRAPGAVAGEVLYPDGNLELVEHEDSESFPAPHIDTTTDRRDRPKSPASSGPTQPDMVAEPGEGRELPAWLLIAAGAAGAAVIMAAAQMLLSR